MNELELLRKELERLRTRVEVLEAQARERDLETRAAFLQIVSGQERRQNIKPEKSRGIRAREV